MWILIKIIFLFIAFFLRIFAKFWPLMAGRVIESKIISGTNVKIIIHGHRSSTEDGHRSSTEGTTLLLDFPCRSIFRLSQETNIDRYFKKIGFSVEIQTGDKNFDKHIYIESDSTAFSDEIKRDENSRKLIMGLFNQGCKYIRCDGKSLSIYFDSDRSKDSPVHKAVDLLLQLRDLDQKWIGFFRDPFAIKALLIEAVIWGLGVYGILGFYEWFFLRGDRHVDGIALFVIGIFIGIVGAVILLTMVFLVLRGSSRGHRIVIESALVLSLAFPVGGIQFLSDINTELDQQPSILIERKIRTTEKRNHGRFKRERYYTYHLYLDHTDKRELLEIYPEIEIESDAYTAAQNATHVMIEIGPGRFNFPWFRSFKFFKKS